MNRTSSRALASVAVLALGVSVSACGAANESSSNSGGSGSGSSSLSGTIKGAGSSAQQAAQQAWTAGFQTQNSNVTINYNPIGSGDGVTQFNAGAVDFAGSDAALDPSAGEVKAAEKRCGGSVLEAPDYVSPIAVIYNLPGVKNLKLDAATTSAIFLGKITKWNDSAIAKLNPGVKLPSTSISPVHRSDDSGTTDNFTDYLNQASGGAWKYPADKTWPIKGGEGANGTSGVVAAVKQGKGTIGYADNSQAAGLSAAEIKVGSAYVSPSAAGAAKAFEASPKDNSRSATDLVYKIDRTTTAAGAYPVMLTSYLIACPSYPKAKAGILKGYLSYIVSSAGQQASVKTAGNAPLPSAVSSAAEKIMGSIKGK